MQFMVILIFSFVFVGADVIEYGNTEANKKGSWNTQADIRSNEDWKTYGLREWNQKTGLGFEDEEKGPNSREEYESGYNLDDDNKKSRSEGYSGHRIYKDSYTEEEKERLDKIFGYTGPTANDEAENLIRPCSVEDWECIRKYLAANSECQPAYGPIPDPFTLNVYTASFTTFNLTISFLDFRLLGLSNTKVNDFYVNKKSGNLMFALDFKNLNFTSPRAYFRYRRTGKESIVLADTAFVFFNALTETVVIPMAPKLRLDFAELHADVKNGFPPFNFGPGSYNSTDPDVLTAAGTFPLLLPFASRESFLFYSQLMTAVYIQRNICDFGLKFITL